MAKDKNNTCIATYDNGRFTEWYVMHTNGVVFELEYVPHQDITIILLHAILDEHEDLDDDNDGMFIVNFIYGKIEDLTAKDVEYYINKWLRKKSPAFITAALRRQKKYKHYTAAKEATNHADT